VLTTVRWSKTANTRQIGVAIVPTGDGFAPAGSDSTLSKVVLANFSASNVAAVQGALAAAMPGSAASAANNRYCS